MKTNAIGSWVFGPAAALALFAAGAFAGGALSPVLPGPLLALAVLALGLRVGVMLVAVEEAPMAPARPAAKTRAPVLHAAHG